MATHIIDKIEYGGEIYQIQDSSALKTHQTIKQDGVTGATINRFGICSTGASTPAKTVSIDSGTFTLEKGAKVTVKFTNKNTANSPSLNVNSTGAKSIQHNGALIASASNKNLLYGTLDFVYDGTYWQLVGNYIDTNTAQNQNAFSYVKVGNTTIGADTTTDTLELVAGDNIVLTPDANNDKVTISVDNIEIPLATQSSDGLMSQRDKQLSDTLDVGGRNLVDGTMSTFTCTAGSNGEGSSNYLNLTTYAIDKRVLHIADEIFTISFNYTLTGNSNANAYIYPQINGSQASLLTVGNRYNTSQSIQKVVENTTQGKYKETIKITAAQAAYSYDGTIRIILKSATSGAIFKIKNFKLEYGTMATDWTASPEELGYKEPPTYSGTKYQYAGEHITLNSLQQPICYIEDYKTTVKPSAFGTSGWQGMDVYGNLMFRTVAGGRCAVYDLNTSATSLTAIGYFNLGSYTGNSDTNHADCLCFSDEFYDANDPFPLLYVTAGDKDHGQCFVERIQRSGNTFSSTLVQTININVTSLTGSGLRWGFPWVQFHSYNGYLYTIGHVSRAIPLDKGGSSKFNNQHIITKFNRPSISRSSVTLVWTDVDNQWTTKYDQHYQQGCRFKDGKIYMIFGHGMSSSNSPNYLMVQSLVSKEKIAEIDLSKGVYKNWVVQCLAIYNNKIIIGRNNSNTTFSITFSNSNRNAPQNIGLATHSADGLLSSSDKIKIDTITQAQTNFLYPRAGTYNNQVWYGGGFVTRKGKAVFFTIPLPGAINRPMTIHCKSLRVRKVGGYLINDIEEGQDSNYTFEYKTTPIGINIIVEKTSQLDANENLPVGIQFDYNLTIQPQESSLNTVYFDSTQSL